MFDTLSRSWEFAKVSYGILWDFKQLIIFPILSSIAALLVSASFLLPLWSSGTLEQWFAFMDEEQAGGGNAAMYMMAFCFYFVNYLVIVFFNVALTACAMKVISGEAPTLGDGLSMATKRLPQIAAWAGVSAIIGVVLKAIENSNEKFGHIIAAVLGMGWTIMTYFVVPVLVLEGVGPIDAIKRSASTLKETWGEAAVGHFSLGLLSMLVMLPAILLAGLLIFFAVGSGSTPLIVAAIVFAVLTVALAAAATSAADVIFQALLYNYATGRSIPADIDTSAFADAFAEKG